MNNIRVIQDDKEVILNIDVVAETKEVLEELEIKILKIKNFYMDENIPIRITGKILSEAEKETMVDIIRRYLDVEIKFDNASELLGLHAIRRTFETETETSETKFIRGSIRSGQKEEYTGSLVILGDVNGGAEVIAGGNIIVVGTLRGMAHAGANGNVKAIISANAVDKIQVRIANIVREIDENNYKCPYIYLTGNEIKIN